MSFPTADPSSGADPVGDRGRPIESTPYDLPVVGAPPAGSTAPGPERGGEGSANGPGSMNGAGRVPAPGRYPAVLAGLSVAAVTALLGLPLGWLWSALAPRTPVVMTSGGAALAHPEQEQMIADEGWYLFLSIGAGIVIAALAWGLLRRYRGPLMLVWLAIGGLFSGVLAYWLGHQIGLSRFRHLAAHAAAGTNFSAPVNLRVRQMGLWHGWLPYVRGDVLTLAITVTLVYLLLAGFAADPSLGVAGRAEEDRAETWSLDDGNHPVPPPGEPSADWRPAGGPGEAGRFSSG